MPDGGVTEYVVGALVAAGASYTVATVIVYVAELLVLNAVVRALAPRAPKPVEQPRTQTATDTLAHGKIVYGMVCVGGAHFLPPLCTTGTNPHDGKQYGGNWTHRGFALAQHEIDSFGPVRFEQAYMDQSSLRAITGTLDDGLVQTSGNAWDSGYGQDRWSMIRCRKGTSTEAVDYILSQADPAAFTSRFRGRGVAHAFVTFAFGDKFPAGAPPVSFSINGKKVYDPRKDSTNGGSGTHRYATPSTWEWCNNPILCAADLIMFDRELGGGGYDPAFDIDWPLVSAAANICDQSVDTAPTIANLVSQGTGAGAVSIVGNTITKTAGVASTWDASARSTVGMAAGRISWRSSVGVSIAGLNNIPNASAGYNDLAYSWSAKGATGWQIWEFGTQITVNPIPTGAVQVTDIAEILYDGTNVFYFLNGKIIRQKKHNTPSELLYFDSSFPDIGAAIVVNQQRRYTGNIELDGGALFEDNLGYLIDASFGRAIDRDGKWRLYAGAWDTPTFTIEQSDWIGAMQIQAVGPRQEGRWNGVRAFYYDPVRNWQRVECNPRTNAAYKTADGGERIWQELDRPAINDESTAQRMAEFTLRQSRNGIKVTGTLPPRFQYLAIWETGLINFADLGWTGKGFRLMNYQLNADGSINVSFCEEQSSDWTDMASAEFNQPDQHLIPVTNEQVPLGPTSMTVTSFTETLYFDVDLPAFIEPGSVVELYEYTASTPYSSATLVASSKSSVILLKKNDNTPHWYWAAIRNPSNHLSDPYPAAASAGLEAYIGENSYIGRGVKVGHGTAYKYSNGLNADNAWDSDMRSVHGYPICCVQFKGGTTAGGNTMIGLSQDPVTSRSFSGIQFAWYNNITDWRIYESSTSILTIAGAVKASDVALITYDNTNIRYYLNGVLKRTVAAAGRTLYLDSSFYGFTDSAVNSLIFGPGLNPGQVDTMQLGDGAATEIVSTDNAATISNVPYTGGSFLSTAIPANASGYTALVTFNALVGGNAAGANMSVAIAKLISGVPSGTTGTEMPVPSTLSLPLTGVSAQYAFDIAANTAATFAAWFTGDPGSSGFAQLRTMRVELIKR